MLSSLNFRNIPKMDELLQDGRFAIFKSCATPSKIAQLLREELNEIRTQISQGQYIDASRDELHETVVLRVYEALHAIHANRLRRVINATGVVMHTNLGRSSLSSYASAKVAEIATSYSNLEYSTLTGRRRSRLEYAIHLLTDLTGAEDALVVNNNAAAVFLALSTLAGDTHTGGASLAPTMSAFPVISEKPQVILSRGEIVEIGDGFRISEIIAETGCRIVEVGATNRTTLDDYQNAITADTAALLKIHSSNYKIVGYTGSVGTDALASLARERGIPLIEDMGSGVLTDLSQFGFPYERTPADAIADGADLVTFSGDKCLGGPQAGIIIGKKSLIKRLRENPIMRCLRIDKLCLAALEATLESYIEGEATPTIRCVSSTRIKEKAEVLQSALVQAIGDTFQVRVMPHNGRFGGGAMPLTTIESYGVYITGRFSPNIIETALRTAEPPIIATIQDDCLVLNMLTVSDEDFQHIIGTFQTLDGLR